MNRPQLYSKYSDLQKTDNTYVLEKFLDTSRFKDEDRILDVGCGDGNFSVECLIPKLPQNFKNFVACDVSEKMLDFARTKYFLPKIKFVALDIGAEEIPEEFENSFNHIYSFYTMHWVRRQRKAFKNIYKMLAPGGDILFTFLANSSLYDIYQNMSKHERWSQHSVKEYISPYHNLKHPEKRLEKLLQDIGFEVKVCKLVTRSFLFPSMEIFKNTITAVNPIVQKLHPDEVEEYNAGFLNEMKGMKSVIIGNVNNNGEKTIREIHQIFILVATKPQNKKSDTSKLE